MLIAAERGNLEPARILLTYNANPNLRDDENNSALLLAEANNHKDLVELLRNPVKFITQSKKQQPTLIHEHSLLSAVVSGTAKQVKTMIHRHLQDLEKLIALDKVHYPLLQFMVSQM